MALTLDRVKGDLQAFVKGGPFMPLWRAVMDTTDEVDQATDLSDNNRQWFAEVYDLVYMSSDGSVGAEDRSLGIMESDDLRRVLQKRSLTSINARPAKKL
jgi:hypothetical protein